MHIPIIMGVAHAIAAAALALNGDRTFAAIQMAGVGIYAFIATAIYIVES